MKCNIHRSKNESGAALPAVLFVSSLLLVGSAFLLSSIGYQSQNATDVLNETKAYYAAESGLQATINVLRFGGVSYSSAVASQDLSSLDVTNGFAYNVDGVVPVGTESSFKIVVWDPDNTSTSTTYNTVGSFQGSDGNYYASRTFGSGADTTTISYVDKTSTTITHPMASNSGTSLGSFRIVSTGAGAAITDFKFKIVYRMTAPRTAARALFGKITSARVVTFESNPNSNLGGTGYAYVLAGGNIFLCNNATCSIKGPTVFTLTLPVPTTSPQDSPTLYANIEAIQPNRLAVRSTGYGPSGTGAMKRLDAVLRKSPFDEITSSAAISMIGPGASLVFAPGTSAQMGINGGSVPSIGVTDTTGLNTVNSVYTQPSFNGTMTPAPAVLGDEIPFWQQSAYEMDNLIRQLRQTAQNSGRYFNGSTPGSWGDFTTGAGITFCDGSCTMGGNSEGGGILVVTGTFFTQGNPKFKGLILAVGPYVSDTNPGGIVRGGGGNEIFIGNTVIAPYNPNDLAAGFSSPRYVQNGGPGDTVFSDIDTDTIFGGQNAATNFILGIAEK